MGIFDIFSSDKNKSEGSQDPLRLELSRMKKGYFVNYDLQTYRVVGYAEYDWGEGYISQEWELTDEEHLLFLEREMDDQVYWTLSQEYKGPELQDIFSEIIRNEDPKEELHIDGEDFRIEESSGGYFCADGKRPGKECIMWSFTDASGKKNFSIYQWGEEDFSAYLGKAVEEYQFTEITPGGEHDA
jgi:hypothetical protein